MKSLLRIFLLNIVLICQAGCRSGITDQYTTLNRQPVIQPDYSGVTIPYNIAPMNFRVMEEGSGFIFILRSASGLEMHFESRDGNIRFPGKSWRKFLNDSRGGMISIGIISGIRSKERKKFQPIYMFVAPEPVDPYICYRLLHPGYTFWAEMKIVQRSTESYRENSILENQLLDGNCMNCHTSLNKDPRRFFVHVRGTKAGTYFVEGEDMKRMELRTPEMFANAVYPAWHPGGKFIAFSSNRIIQSVHMIPNKDHAFYDIFSSLVLYNTENNEMKACFDSDSVRFMDTLPFWSPAGDFLYFCRTEQVGAGSGPEDVKYDLIRKSFDPLTGTFGRAEMVFNASAINKSASFPSVSPDGKFLVFTLSAYGTFPVWHKEADLYLMDLQTAEVSRLSLNSDDTESYHAWSSNGKWLVFSSKRDDGLNSRPYFAYIDSAGCAGKPFILPQKDPELYNTTEYTFNRTEFITGRITAGPRDFARASRNEAVRAIWSGKNP